MPAYRDDTLATHPSPDPAEPLLLTPEEAAELLHVGRTTVYGLMGSGELVSIRVGGARRVPRREVDAFIARKINAVMRGASR